MCCVKCAKIGKIARRFAVTVSSSTSTTLRATNCRGGHTEIVHVVFNDFADGDITLLCIDIGVASIRFLFPPAFTVSSQAIDNPLNRCSLPRPSLERRG